MAVGWGESGRSSEILVFCFVFICGFVLFILGRGVGFVLFFQVKGAVLDQGNFAFDLCRGSERGHAMSDDTASLLVHAAKMDSVSGDLPALCRLEY